MILPFDLRGLALASAVTPGPIGQETGQSEPRETPVATNFGGARRVNCPGCGAVVVMDDATCTVRHAGKPCASFREAMAAAGMQARHEPWVAFAGVRPLTQDEKQRMTAALQALNAPHAPGEPVEPDAFAEYRLRRLQRDYPDVCKLIGCAAP